MEFIYKTLCLNIMKIFEPLLIVSIGLLFSCQNKQNSKAEKFDVNDTTLTNIDSIKRYLPDNYEGSWNKRDIVKFGKLLKLKSIENGYGSLQIRFYLDCGGNERGSVVVLKTRKSNWNATIYSFTKVYDPNTTESGGTLDFYIQDIQKTNVIPKSGWDVFSEELSKTGILDIKSYSDDSNFQITSEWDYVLVEIGTTNKYTLTNYSGLGWKKDMKESPIKLASALRLIETEFNYTLPCDHDHFTQ